jgi:hypothetical protein
MNSLILNISKNVGLKKQSFLAHSVKLRYGIFTLVNAVSYGFYINLRPDHDFVGKQPILYKYYLRKS